MNSFQTKRHRFLKYLSCFFGLLVFGIAVVSCKKDLTSTIGGGLQPDDEFIGAFFNDTAACLNLVAYSVQEDSAITSGFSSYALGSYNHPTFGTMTANIVTQVSDITGPDTDTVAYIDSVVLEMQWDNNLAYPFEKDVKMAPITISIGELDYNEALNVVDDTERKVFFNTTKPFPYDNSFSVFPENQIDPNRFFDSIMDPNDSSAKITVPVARLLLSNAYGQKLLDASKSTKDSTINAFIREIPGLYFQSKAVQSGQPGHIINFDFYDNAPVITVYFHRKETDTAPTLKSYQLGNNVTYNYIEYDRSLADANFTAQLAGDTALGEQKVFLQACGSSSINVLLSDSIRNLKNIAGGKPIVINLATLVLKVDPQSGGFTPPAQLELKGFTDTTSITLIDEDRLTLGGSFDKNKSEYRFFITNYVQQLLLNENLENYPLKIFSSYAIPDLAVIFGPKAAPHDKRMRLEVVYSVVQP
jgi:hypothetical protein